MGLANSSGSAMFCEVFVGMPKNFKGLLFFLGFCYRPRWHALGVLTLAAGRWETGYSTCSRGCVRGEHEVIGGVQPDAGRTVPARWLFTPCF